MLSQYNQLLVEQICNKFKTMLQQAEAGHCMKLSGVSDEVLKPMLDQFRQDVEALDVYILSHEQTNANYITATKLIELRNLEAKPLLILIPANLRTAAEDSFGNATFRELDISDIERLIYSKLLEDTPSEVKRLLEEEVFFFLRQNNFTQERAIQFLIDLKKKDYDKEEIGDFLYHFHLLPDERLFEDISKAKVRLNINLQCIQQLTSFNKSIYDRINGLPITKKPEKPYISLKEIQKFLKTHPDLKTGFELGKEIATKSKKLNLGNWHIPEVENLEEIKLEVLDLQSKKITYNEDGELQLDCEQGKAAKLTVKFTTTPPPSVAPNLAFFRIDLMRTEGGYEPEKVDTLIKFKNTQTKAKTRKKLVTLSSSTIDEGYYFLKLVALDINENQLNIDDDFRDKETQREWEEEKKAQKDKADKTKFVGKLKSDSDTFLFVVDDELPDGSEDNDKKNVVPTVLHAYVSSRIKQLNANNPLVDLEPHERDWQWLTLAPSKLESTFIAKYQDTTERFQISMPYKLYAIEQEILKNAQKLGCLSVEINTTNPIEEQNIHYSSSILNDIVSPLFLDKRKELFEAIRADIFTDASDSEHGGTIATFKLYEHSELVKEYLHLYSTWCGDLLEAQQTITEEQTNRSEAKQLLRDLQLLDTVHLTTRLPNHTKEDVFLLSPLHPLRLSWMLQVWEVYQDWEKQTIEHVEYRKYWENNLDKLFLEELYPTNNPLVLSGATPFKSYEYAGELLFGWGLYIRTLTERYNHSMSAKSRLMLRYIQHILNIPSNQYSELDVKSTLIAQHIKNYIRLNPYVEQLNINLFNTGEAYAFADALIEIEKDKKLRNLRYEVRLFVNNDGIVESGTAFKELLNPEGYLKDGAERFIEIAENRLFPKIRFSIASVKEYIDNANLFDAHLSFLVNPFPLRTTVYQPKTKHSAFYLNNLVAFPQVDVSYNESTGEFTWARYLQPPSTEGELNPLASIFANYQRVIATNLASSGNSLPSTELSLNAMDSVLIEQVHTYSEWVVTFDRHLGPEIFDSKRGEHEIPFLLDYVPNDDILGVSTFLTAKPSARIEAIIRPHLERMGYEIASKSKVVLEILEDIRAVSGSLLLRLNANENTVLEVIGIALAKRFLQSQQILANQFIVPIDLHQYLFDKSKSYEEDKSRADLLLVSINKDSRTINLHIIEVKARHTVVESLKGEIGHQLDNTEKVLENHFLINKFEKDRLDRALKNKELVSLLTFYIERAARYGLLDVKTKVFYLNFLQTLDNGYQLEIDKTGLIFNFNSNTGVVRDNSLNDKSFFTIGNNIIELLLSQDEAALTNEQFINSSLTKRLTKRVVQSKLVKQIRTEMDKAAKRRRKKVTELPTTEDTGATSVEPMAEEATPNTNPVTSVSVEKTYSNPVEDKAPIETITPNVEEPVVEYQKPDYDLIVGTNKESLQFGILGKTINDKNIALDLNETQTISLFGVQGAGKSYTIGSVTEMVLKTFSKVNQLEAPLAGVIFHYSESEDYKPEFTSMKYKNDGGEISILKNQYGALPDNIDDVVLLVPKDKLEQRKLEYPDLEIHPISFASSEIGIKEWKFLMGAVNNSSLYMKQINNIMRSLRKNLTYESLIAKIENSNLLGTREKELAQLRLTLAEEFIDDNSKLQDLIQPGRILIVDLRDEFIEQDDALGLFVIMLNIFSNAKNADGSTFNKFIVFDEAHKYMGNKDLTSNIVTAIREMRHKGVSMMIASQDPPSLPNEIIELSTLLMLHRFNSPQWLKHIKKSIAQLDKLTPQEMANLGQGEAYMWASKANDKRVTQRPIRIKVRPRVTKHGGGTQKASD